MPTRTTTAAAEKERCFARLKADRDYVVYKKSKAIRDKFAEQDARAEAKRKRQAKNKAEHNKRYRKLDDGTFVKQKKQIPPGLAADRKNAEARAAKDAANQQAAARKSKRLKETTYASGGGKDPFFSKYSKTHLFITDAYQSHSSLGLAFGGKFF
jgi:hypothetical protein